MKDDIFANASNITAGSCSDTVRRPEEKEVPAAVCVGEEKDSSGMVTGYQILENGSRDTYCAEYLTSLIKTGRMTVSNMKYDQEKCCLVYV